MKFYGLIIAAGYSSRFGSLKALAKWKNSNFLKTIIHKLNNICENTTVVTGFESEQIKYDISEIQNIKTVLNENYKKGMIYSVIKGFEYFDFLNRDDYIVFQPVDIPGVKKNTYKAMKDYIVENKSFILKPSYNMKCGHPVIFRADVAKKICNLHYSNPDISLKTIIEKFKEHISYFECNDEFILKDYDYSHEISISEKS